ncbi:MAG: hypothetical protein CBC42_01405 [Betaproteobacteria bacterium TMED82]|nr:MAG: hypothetical protein CBC42_01405 [Betaproteobacteria bacterium TMED82]|tara:strand:- start:30230 stop:30430 length:201 start_codon:yes stop_codon:yes gene_type:complete
MIVNVKDVKKMLDDLSDKFEDTDVGVGVAIDFAGDKQIQNIKMISFDEHHQKVLFVIDDPNLVISL